MSEYKRGDRVMGKNNGTIGVVYRVIETPHGPRIEIKWPSGVVSTNEAHALSEPLLTQLDRASERVRNEDADAVNHPRHYTSDPSGVECIEITRHRNFDIGSAIKHLWRAGLKEDAGLDPLEKQIEDLHKSIFYINDEIKRLEES